MYQNSKVRKPIILIASAAISGACSPSNEHAGVTRRDSLGIEIVESTDPLWQDGHAWSLSPAPEFQIGTMDGPEDQQLFRVFSALRLSEDRILIANAGSGELRFYHPDGTLLKSSGGTGAGPGEFGQFASMRTWLDRNGSLISYDNGNDRVNVFDSTGTFVRTVHFMQTPEAPRVFLWGTLDNGTWLGAAPAGGGRLSGNPGDIIESEFLYVMYSDSGRYLKELFRLPGRTRYIHSDRGLTRYPYVPLLAERFVVPARLSVYVIAGQQAEIQVWDAGGSMRSLWRWRAQLQRPLSNVWDRYKRETLERRDDPDDRRWYASYYEQDLPLPEVTPAANKLMVDRQGFVWIERYKMPWDEDNPWDVFAPTGEWLGWVDLPRSLQVFDIGEDYVLGKVVDDLGVERVQVWTLRREPSEERGVEM